MEVEDIIYQALREIRAEQFNLDSEATLEYVAKLIAKKVSSKFYVVAYSTQETYE